MDTQGVNGVRLSTTAQKYAGRQAMPHYAAGGGQWEARVPHMQHVHGGTGTPAQPPSRAPDGGYPSDGSRGGGATDRSERSWHHQSDATLTASFPSRGWASDCASDAPPPAEVRYDWRARRGGTAVTPSPLTARPPADTPQTQTRKVYDWRARSIAADERMRAGVRGPPPMNLRSSSLEYPADPAGTDASPGPASARANGRLPSPERGHGAPDAFARSASARVLGGEHAAYLAERQARRSGSLGRSADDGARRRSHSASSAAGNSERAARDAELVTLLRTSTGGAPGAAAARGRRSRSEDAGSPPQHARQGSAHGTGGGGGAADYGVTLEREVRRLSIELEECAARLSAKQVVERETAETNKAVHVCLRTLQTVYGQDGGGVAPPRRGDDSTRDRQSLCVLVETAGQHISAVRRELARVMPPAAQAAGGDIDVMAEAVAGSVVAGRRALCELLDSFDALGDVSDVDKASLPSIADLIARHLRDMKQLTAEREVALERMNAKVHSLQQECLHLACELNEERASAKAAARLRADIAAQSDTASSRLAVVSAKWAASSGRVADALAGGAQRRLLGRYYRRWALAAGMGATQLPRSVPRMDSDGTYHVEEQLAVALEREVEMGEAALAAEMRLRELEQIVEEQSIELAAAREQLQHTADTEARAHDLEQLLRTRTAAAEQTIRHLEDRLAQGAQGGGRSPVRIEDTLAQHLSASAKRSSAEVEALNRANSALGVRVATLERKRAHCAAHVADLLAARNVAHVVGVHFRVWRASVGRTGAAAPTSARLARTDMAAAVAAGARRALMRRYFDTFHRAARCASAVDNHADAAAAQIASVQRCVASFRGRLLDTLSRHVSRTLLARYFSAWQHVATHNPEPRPVRRMNPHHVMRPATPSQHSPHSTRSGSDPHSFGHIPKPIVGGRVITPTLQTQSSPLSTRSGERRFF